MNYAARTDKLIEMCRTNRQKRGRSTVNDVLVTPELAKRLLACWHNNRPAKISRQNIYQRKLRNGEWRSFAHGIVLDENGYGIDGWNRLTAIVATGVAAVMDVTFGDPAANYVLFNDKVALRNSAERLAIENWEEGWDSKTSIIVAQRLAAIQQMLTNRNTQSGTENLFPIFKLGIDWSLKAIKMVERRGGWAQGQARFQQATVSGPLAWAWMVEHELVEDAVSHLANIAPYDDVNDPVLVLERTRLHAQKDVTGANRRPMMLEVITALYCKKTGEKFKLSQTLERGAATSTQERRALDYFRKAFAERYEKKAGEAVGYKQEVQGSLVERLSAKGAA